MVNNLKPRRAFAPTKLFCLVSIIMLAPPVAFQSEAAAPKYKKNTVIDFEGALVEGKSRKPYSSYLTQQKESAFADLHTWEPDLDRNLLESQRRLDKSL
jgi:hypothetical protein